jgi:hypothetical protein
MARESFDSFDTLSYDSTEEFMPDVLKTLLKQTKSLQSLENLQRSVVSEVQDLKYGLKDGLNAKERKSLQSMTARMDAVEVSLQALTQQLGHLCALMATLRRE